jgi:hypothetical protein
LGKGAADLVPKYLYYHVRPHEHLPAGMRPVTLAVLSPVWQGPEITIIYPDGWQQTLIGWIAAGSPGDLKIFWTQAPEPGPTVCLAIGGDGGVRLFDRTDVNRQPHPSAPARPFLALADSLIPAAVQAVIGPPPPRASLLLL